MPIEKKPEQIVLSGEEARQAIIDGVQRKLGKRIDEKTMKISSFDASFDVFTVTVDVIGGLKGAKTGVKRGPRKAKAAPTPPPTVPPATQNSDKSSPWS